MDLGDKVRTECEQEMSSTSSSSNSSGVTNNTSEDGKLRTCADCNTTKTPLWRSGPAGPKSLCNACGIRSRKRRRALLGLTKTSIEHKKPKKINSSNRIISDDNDSTNKSKIMAFRIPMSWQKTKVRRKLGEEERAAMLLMALSCGSVY